MKNLIYLIILLTIMSCNTTETIEPNVNNKQVTIGVKIGGELKISEVPLARGLYENPNVYAVQIYEKVDDDDEYYSHYAYGLFDNLSQCIMKLNPDKKYRIEVSLVEDTRNVIISEDVQNGIPALSYPYTTRSRMDCYSYWNLFKYTSEDYFEHMCTGSSYVDTSDYQSIIYREVNRYYGIIDDYTPTDGETIHVDMKRMVFGVKFTVANLNEGTITIRFNGLSTRQTEYKIESANGNTFEATLSLLGGIKSWIDDDYVEYVPITILHDVEGKNSREIYKGSISVKRLMLYNIDFDALDNRVETGVNGGITVSLDESEFIGNENVTL